MHKKREQGVRPLSGLNKAFYTKLEELMNRKAFNGLLTSSVCESSRDFHLGIDDPMFSRIVPPFTIYSDRIAELDAANTRQIAELRANHSGRITELQDKLAKLNKENQRLQLFEPSNADGGGGATGIYGRG